MDEIDRAQERKAIAQGVIQPRAGACFVCGQAFAKGEKRAGAGSAGNSGSASRQRHLETVVCFPSGHRIITQVLDDHGKSLNTAWGHFSLTNRGWIADTDPTGSITLDCRREGLHK